MHATYDRTRAPSNQLQVEQCLTRDPGTTQQRYTLQRDREHDLTSSTSPAGPLLPREIPQFFRLSASTAKSHITRCCNNPRACHDFACAWPLGRVRLVLRRPVWRATFECTAREIKRIVKLQSTPSGYDCRRNGTRLTSRAATRIHQRPSKPLSRCSQRAAAFQHPSLWPSKRADPSFVTARRYECCCVYIASAPSVVQNGASTVFRSSPGARSSNRCHVVRFVVAPHWSNPHISITFAGAKEAVDLHLLRPEHLSQGCRRRWQGLPGSRHECTFFPRIRWQCLDPQCLLGQPDLQHW